MFIHLCACANDVDWKWLAKEYWHLKRSKNSLVLSAIL